MNNLSPLTPKPSRVLFIDEAYLKDTTFLNENIDPKLLIPAIKLSQDKHIMFICGSGIVEELKTQIATNTLTALNTSLLEDFIQPCLAWWSISEILPSLVWRLQNKGMEKKNSENSTAPEKDDIVFLQAKYEETAKYYARLLINYLKRNNDSYPLYYNQGGQYGTNVDTIYGVSTEYFSGLVTPQAQLGTGNNDITGLGIGADIVFVPRR